MAANTSPIFPRVPQNEWAAPLTAANTAKDGTGTVSTVFTADAVEGSRVDFLRVRSLGTNVATVIRVFINNGLTNATPANNILFTERTIPSTSVSEVAEQQEITIPMNLGLAAGYKVNVTIGTAVAAGLAVSAHGGKY